MQRSAGSSVGCERGEPATGSQRVARRPSWLSAARTPTPSARDLRLRAPPHARTATTSRRLIANAGMRSIEHDRPARPLRGGRREPLLAALAQLPQVADARPVRAAGCSSRPRAAPRRHRGARCRGAGALDRRGRDGRRVRQRDRPRATPTSTAGDRRLRNGEGAATEDTWSATARTWPGSIAGTGAASRGKIRGAAPGARSSASASHGRGARSSSSRPEPSCFTALDKGAKIINLSWGRRARGQLRPRRDDGRQVRLRKPRGARRRRGGERGQRAERLCRASSTVGSPATAKNVLTVGACTSDRRTSTSPGAQLQEAPTSRCRRRRRAHGRRPRPAGGAISRGPDRTTDAVKPDVLAPGTVILAPRADRATISFSSRAYDEAALRLPQRHQHGDARSSRGAAAVLRQYLREERDTADTRAPRC